MGIFTKSDDEKAPTQKGFPSLFTKPLVASATKTVSTITAAATKVNINDKGEVEQFKARRAAASATWQQEAWEYYDAIGEIKYAFNLVASVVSRIRIFSAVIDDPSSAPVSVRASTKINPELAAASERALARLDSSFGGQAGLLRDTALNLSVVGECYLVQMPAQYSGTPESWDIRSVDEIILDTSGRYSIVGRRDQTATSGTNKKNGAKILPDKAFVGRIWRNHPRYSDEADSSMRGLLDLCGELLLLNRTFRATARSRLNAGALYLPDGLSVAAQGDPNYPDDDENNMNPPFTAEEAQDDFEEQLMDAMTTPIRDEASASAVVPLIIRGPADLGEKIKVIKFERAFDEALIARADRVLERILQGIDVPKDVVTGMASVKYSNALQIDESLYKAHIEPLMLLIVDAFTVVYLRPYLIAQGYNEAEVNRIVVWYDPSAVATRNDKAADADAGFINGSVSHETWRRAHGFSEADAPTANEVAIRAALEKGSITPELTEAILNVVSPELMNLVKQNVQGGAAADATAIPPQVQEALDSALGTTAPTDATPAGEAPADNTQEVTPTEGGTQ